MPIIPIVLKHCWLIYASNFKPLKLIATIWSSMHLHGILLSWQPNWLGTMVCQKIFSRTNFSLVVVIIHFGDNPDQIKVRPEKSFWHTLLGLLGTLLSDSAFIIRMNVYTFVVKNPYWLKRLKRVIHKSRSTTSLDAPQIRDILFYWEKEESAPPL